MTPADQRVHTAVPLAMQFVGAVHDYDIERAHALMRTADLPAVAVALAAMVDPDCRPSELLGWTRPPARKPKRRGGPVPHRPCGTHAAFKRHKNHGEDPCPVCVLGERQYQAERHLRRKAAA